MVPVKVAIMTLFHNSTNYGGILQAYALQKTIESLGFECVVLDYQRNINDITQVTNSKIQRLIGKVTNIRSIGDIINIGFLPIRKYWARSYEAGIRTRKQKFSAFITNNMKVSEYFDNRTIHLTQNDYDVFICGSDQIWRPTTFDPNFFLDFIDQDKQRISYAASLGVNALSKKEKDIFTPLVNKLDAISVREKSATPIISDLTKKEVVRVLDPTLLLDRDFWITKLLTENKSYQEEEYIFSYQISDNNANRDLVKKAGKLLRMKTVTIPGLYKIQPYDFCYADTNMVDASPEDFLSLIAHSKCVITDSFHACVFSILFGKKFIALERNTNSDRLSMSSRIYDLLELFSIPDRLLIKPDQLEKLLNSDVNLQVDNWKQLKSFSKDFLSKNISGA